MNSQKLPTAVIWDTSYACPLRCTHCYSESGRRPAKRMPFETMLKMADVLSKARIKTVLFSGGEPLLVKGIFQIAERLQSAGVEMSLFTNGWELKEEMIPEIARLFSKVHISIDGATHFTHDRIRGRKGSFDRAIRALTLFNDYAEKQAKTGLKPLKFGIDCVVLQSNFNQLELYCLDIARRFSRLNFLNLGAGVPSGLANRESFAQHELLNEDQLEQIQDQDFVNHLKELAPLYVETVDVFDNFRLQFHPDHFKNGVAREGVIQMEPDGNMRAMLIYEGTVGNILEEPLEALWAKAVARRSDPFVVAALKDVRNMQEWAEAARKIDYHFTNQENCSRIDGRPSFVPDVATK